jgi:L,D-peptidoglycan transpeptidase YkuD (ErfK/YbiS/YcfS/YnhG family)
LFVGCADTQKLIVTPDKASPQTAKMEFVENGKIVNIYDVLIGRNGAAKDGEKREGDGKTPSGTFKITSIFGKSDNGFDKMGFIKTYPDLYCIDDVKSENYNKIADKNLIKKDFNSEFILSNTKVFNTFKPIPFNIENNILFIKISRCSLFIKSAAFCSNRFSHGERFVEYYVP